MKLHISNGNTKIEAIPNVSLTPIKSCKCGVPCSKGCYAMKFYKMYPSVKKAWDDNLDLWEEDKMKFFNEIYSFLAKKNPWGFRWFVGGDIPSAEFFSMMCKIAEEFPNTQFLAFTKQHEIVNECVWEWEWASCTNNVEDIIPSNLHLIFSGWGENFKIDNPHNFPTSQVIFKGEEPRPEWKICGGNCTDCKCRGVGCWELKYGETIAFYEH